MKSDLSIVSISSCINDLDFVNFLYDGLQGVPKNIAFKKYNKFSNLPQVNENKSNYVERGFRVTCERNENQNFSNQLSNSSSGFVIGDLDQRSSFDVDECLDDLLRTCDEYVVLVLKL